MTTKTRNEAAERLRANLRDAEWDASIGDLDEALASERRATVERIRQSVLTTEHEYLWPPEVSDPDQWTEEMMGSAAAVIAGVLNILDEEAAR